MSETFKKAGYKVFTIDNNPDLKPDLCIDILKFTIQDLPKEFRTPGVVWASPPCPKFSVLTISKYWINGKPKTWKTYLHLAIAKKTLELIQELKPKYWFIENPRGMLRKQYFMDELNRKTVTYCQYGSEYRKPTDIFNNAYSWIPKMNCKPGSNCHINAERGARKGIQGVELTALYNWDGSTAFERSKIPKNLCEEIVSVCENRMKEIQEVLLLSRKIIL